MPPGARNLVNLSAVAKDYGSRAVLREVTLGISTGERIGVVGANGEGKSTLLRLIAGVESPDAGALTRARGVDVALLGQHDELDDQRTIREVLVGTRADHEWAGDGSFRAVLDGLMGGVALDLFAHGIDTPISGLSGGERRRVALAHLLLDPPELLLLDEPTNHLDVEGIDWLGRHLAARRGAMLVVTHDRWFLDAACASTWEVADGAVHRYDGGYAAYVLARAERDRQAQARESRRRQLLRKELAWLRRGPPARTSKPKFRIQAANALIADEPQARDRAELLRFATARLGDVVLDTLDVSLTLGTRALLDGLTWQLGPGERVGLVGVNGSGKTSLLRLLAGELQPGAGEVRRGATVRLAHLSQDAAELPLELRVIEALEEVRGYATLGDGQEIGAAMLCERFGFRGEKARAFVGELSGGERRRLALMRLLMAEPNVLLLDEPTNDLDVETLTALEDLLDGWPGTLVVVSHDRYFMERVCDDLYALGDTGRIRHLPGGIDEYLQLRRSDSAERQAEGRRDGDPQREGTAGRGGAAQSDDTRRHDGAEHDGERTPRQPGLSPGARGRAARKETQRAERECKRLERAIERIAAQERALGEQMQANPTDHAQLAQLQSELDLLVLERGELESAWLATSELLEG
jgi:ABC transport system ATP-binding/permease protein